MKSLGFVLLLASGFAVLSGLTTIQETGYAATRSPLEYVTGNDYMLWFLQGADTVGQPVSTQNKETHRYSGAGELLDVDVRLEGIDMPFESRQTMKIRRTGRIVEVDGTPVGELESARVDFLPRIPVTGALEAGRTWIDTVSSSGTQPCGETNYRARRAYRVVGPAEVEGMSAVLLVAEGSLALRQGGWQSEQQGVFWWQEVEGPVVDSVWFALEGHVIKDITSMDLTGTGGFGNGDQQTEMASGLRSRVERALQTVVR